MLADLQTIELGEVAPHARASGSASPWRTVGVVLGVLRGIGSPYFAGNNE
jgi:hypothetical protein